MNTKLKTVLYWLVAFLPLLITLAVLPKLPTQVPMQYDLSGQISRMGNKYEMLFLPGLTILMAVSRRSMAQLMCKFPRGEHNVKVFGFTCWMVIVFLGVTSLVMLYYTGVQAQNIMRTPAVKILSLLMSVLFVVLGNILPKCKRTGSYLLSIGFRTPWTLRSDMVWAKVNRLGGYAMVGAGLVSIIASLVLPGWWSLMIATGLIVAVALWGVVYSWWLYKGENLEP